MLMTAGMFTSRYQNLKKIGEDKGLNVQGREKLKVVIIASHQGTIG